MSLKTQSKVLRTLDEGRFAPVGEEEPITVDARVIAATNKDLEDEISKGNFREDLFYRLNVIPFYVPPLRERKEDIPLLARHFLKDFSQTYNRRPKEISDDALDALMRYSWPGNVRELRNLIERIVIMNPSVTQAGTQAPADAGLSRGRPSHPRRLLQPAPGARRLRARLHPEEARREPRQRQPHRRGARPGAQPHVPQDESAGNHRQRIASICRLY